MILDAYREQELRNHRFMAAIQGIDIDSANKRRAEEDFRRVDQRVQARLSGKTEKELEFNELGFDVETEEE